MIDDHYGLPVRSGLGNGDEQLESTGSYPPAKTPEEALQDRICQANSTALVLRALCRGLPITEECRAMIGSVCDELHELRNESFTANL